MLLDVEESLLIGSPFVFSCDIINLILWVQYILSLFPCQIKREGSFALVGSDQHIYLTRVYRYIDASSQFPASPPLWYLQLAFVCESGGSVSPSMKTLWSRPRRMWDRTIKVPLGFFIVLAGIAAAILLYEWGAIMYGATVQQLSLGVPLRGNVHFKYTNPRNGKSFSACLCPKCGSSSVKEWLYWSLKGHRFVKNNTAGMRLHFFDSWDVPGVHSDRVSRCTCVKNIYSWKSRFQSSMIKYGSE